MVYLLQEERRAVPKFPPQKRAMEYRSWKNAPVRTSLLGYGCMRFPTTPEGRIDEPRAEALLNAARDAGVQLRQIEARQQCADHPILWGVEETNYLKFFIFQVV